MHGLLLYPAFPARESEGNGARLLESYRAQEELNNVKLKTPQLQRLFPNQ